MDIQEMIDMISRVQTETRAHYHLSIGKLIEFLQKYEDDYEHGNTTVRFDTYGAKCYPGELISYRGYFCDLAITPVASLCTVSTLLNRCKKALGTEIIGYKGGEFLITQTTSLWCAEYGDTTGLAVIGIYLHDDGTIVLKTHRLNHLSANIDIDQLKWHLNEEKMRAHWKANKHDLHQFAHEFYDAIFIDDLEDDLDKDESSK